MIFHLDIELPQHASGISRQVSSATNPLCDLFEVAKDLSRTLQRFRGFQVTGKDSTQMLWCRTTDMSRQPRCHDSQAISHPHNMSRPCSLLLTRSSCPPSVTFSPPQIQHCALELRRKHSMTRTLRKQTLEASWVYEH